MTVPELPTVLGIADLGAATIVGVCYVVLCLRIFQSRKNRDAANILRQLVGKGFIVLFVLGIVALIIPVLITKIHQ